MLLVEVGIPPAFRNIPTLRVYKILYSSSAKPITEQDPKIKPG